MTDRAARRLPVRRLGIDTYQERVIYMHADSQVCRSEGFEARSLIEVRLGTRSLIATLNVVHSDLLGPDEAGLSEAAWKALAAQDGDHVLLSHPEPIESFTWVRSKIYGQPFSDAALREIVEDIARGRYSALETAAFITACAGEGMSLEESVALTRAMVDVGARLSWSTHPVVDKHCVGGLPGNRTTPIVVAIVAACGLTIPKTSSRAITSPAGTADTMEMLAPVELSLAHMRRVVESEGGCIVWGGSMALSPVDDLLIRVARPLEFDSLGQLTASIVFKKAAAGSTHVVIDMPVGPTLKVRHDEAASNLARRLIDVAASMGIEATVVQSDGSQPVGRGIGPALEAEDVLAVLQGRKDAPADLRAHALSLAAALLELGGVATAESARAAAESALDSGRAWTRFQAICEAQGGMRMPPRAAHTLPVCAARSGRVLSFDNRKLAKAAKLAGAPRAPVAGLLLHVRLGDSVEIGEPLFTLHAETAGELDYARAYIDAHPDLVGTGDQG